MKYIRKYVKYRRFRAKTTYQRISWFTSKKSCSRWYIFDHRCEFCAAILCENDIWEKSNNIRYHECGFVCLEKKKMVNNFPRKASFATLQTFSWRRVMHQEINDDFGTNVVDTESTMRYVTLNNGILYGKYNENLILREPLMTVDSRATVVKSM